MRTKTSLQIAGVIFAVLAVPGFLVWWSSGDTDPRSTPAAIPAHVPRGRASQAPPDPAQATPEMIVDWIAHGNTGALRTAWGNDTLLRHTGANGWTWLHWAVFYDMPEVTRLAVELGLSPLAGDAFGLTPRALALVKGDTNLLAALQNDVSKGDVSALFRDALRHGNEDAALVFLEQIKEPLAVDPDSGLSPLHLAAGRGMERLTSALLASSADKDPVDLKGRTPLHHAAGRGSAGAMRLLLEAGAAIHAKDADGFTPLHWAARGGHPEACRLLLEAGANPTLPGGEASSTATTLAIDAGHLDVMELFLFGEVAPLEASPSGETTASLPAADDPQRRPRPETTPQGVRAPATPEPSRPLPTPSAPSSTDRTRPASTRSSDRPPQPPASGADVLPSALPLHTRRTKVLSRNNIRQIGGGIIQYALIDGKRDPTTLHDFMRMGYIEPITLRSPLRKATDTGDEVDYVLAPYYPNLQMLRQKSPVVWERAGLSGNGGWILFWDQSSTFVETTPEDYARLTHALYHRVDKAFCAEMIPSGSFEGFSDERLAQPTASIPPPSRHPGGTPPPARELPTLQVPSSVAPAPEDPRMMRIREQQAHVQAWERAAAFQDAFDTVSRIHETILEIERIMPATLAQRWAPHESRLRQTLLPRLRAASLAWESLPVPDETFAALHHEMRVALANLEAGLRDITAAIPSNDMPLFERGAQLYAKGAQHAEAFNTRWQAYRSAAVTGENRAARPYRPLSIKEEHASYFPALEEDALEGFLATLTRIGEMEELDPNRQKTLSRTWRPHAHELRHSLLPAAAHAVTYLRSNRPRHPALLQLHQVFQYMSEELESALRDMTRAVETNDGALLDVGLRRIQAIDAAGDRLREAEKRLADEAQRYRE